MTKKNKNKAELNITEEKQRNMTMADCTKQPTSWTELVCLATVLAGGHKQWVSLKQHQCALRSKENNPARKEKSKSRKGGEETHWSSVTIATERLRSKGLRTNKSLWPFVLVLGQIGHKVHIVLFYQWCKMRTPGHTYSNGQHHRCCVAQVSGAVPWAILHACMPLITMFPISLNVYCLNIPVHDWNAVFFFLKGEVNALLKPTSLHEYDSWHLPISSWIWCIQYWGCAISCFLESAIMLMFWCTLVSQLLLHLLHAILYVSSF